MTVRNMYVGRTVRLSKFVIKDFLGALHELFLVFLQLNNKSSFIAVVSSVIVLNKVCRSNVVLDC